MRLFLLGLLSVMSIANADGLDFDSAARYYDIHPALLTSIAEIESNMNPNSMNYNKMKAETRERAKSFFKNIGVKTQSYGDNNQHLSIDCRNKQCAELAVAYATNNNINYDIGLMNTNSVHMRELSQYNISPLQLLDPNLSIHVGAWELSRCLKRYGENVSAINCYNGMTKNNKYYMKVVKAYQAQQGKL